MTASERPQGETGHTRNSELLRDFVAYCEANPDMRFWQALRNWSGWNYILAAANKDKVRGEYKDTFYWEGQDE